MRRAFAGLALLVGPFRLSSSDSIRPLITAAAAAIVYFALSSRTAREDARRLRRPLTPQRVALLLTSVVITVGVAHNSWAVGGSASYSYASQMDLRSAWLGSPRTRSSVDRGDSPTFLNAAPADAHRPSW